MTLFEALPDDITEAIYHYCKDDECLNDATLRALRTELKLGKAEHDKYSHDCFRCDKFKEYKNEFEPRVAELKNRNAELKGMYVHSAREAGTYKQFLESKEKENAGLKARLNAINSLTPELEKASKLKERQLAAAKEIIKELLDTQSRLDPYRDIFKDRILKAEQFLEEVKE